MGASVRPQMPPPEDALSPADLWDKKIAEGMPPEQATAYVAAKHGAPPAPRAPGVRPTAPAPGQPGEAIPEWGKALNSFAQGATFGFGDEVLGGIAGADAMLNGKTFAEGYDPAVAKIRGVTKDYRAEHPVAAGATELAGAIVPSLAGAGLAKLAGEAPAAAGAARAAAEGTRFARWLKATGKAAGIGAAAGGVAGAGNAEGGIGERAGGALSGGIAGGVVGGTAGGVVLPLARAAGGAVARGVDAVAPDFRPKTLPGPGASPFARAKARFMTPVQSQADEMLLRSLERDKVTPDALRASVDENLASGASAKPKSIMEYAGRNTRMLGKVVQMTPSEGSESLVNATEARSHGNQSRLLGDLFETSGSGRRDLSETADELLAKRKEAAAPLYEKAYQAPDVTDPDVTSTMQTPAFRSAYKVAQRIAKAEGKPLPDLPTADAVDPWTQIIPDRIKGDPAAVEAFKAKTTAMNPALAKEMDAAAKPLAFSVRALDYTKQGLDDLIERRMRSGKMGSKDARALRQTLNGMLEKVDAAVPDYAAARAQYSDDSKLISALEKGKDHFGTDDPAVGRKLLAGMSDGEREMYRHGALSSLAQKVQDVNRPWYDTANRPEWTTEGGKARLRDLFPDDASFSRFLSKVEQEHGISKTHRTITGGSSTAQNLKALEDADNVAPAIAQAGIGRFGQAAATLARGAAAQSEKKLGEARADALAQRLVAGMKNPEDVKAVVDALERAGIQAVKRNGRQVFTKALAREAGASKGQK